MHSLIYFSLCLEPHVRCNSDSTVTVCRDFVRGGCQRLLCRYYHPLAHIYSQLESAAMPGVMAPQVDDVRHVRFSLKVSTSTPEAL